MFMSKSQSNMSSHSHILSLSQSSSEKSVPEFQQHNPHTSIVNACYKKFINKLGLLFRIDPEDLDTLYHKISECVDQNEDIGQASDGDITQMIQIASQLKKNNNLLKNMVNVLDEKYLSKNKIVEKQEQEDGRTFKKQQVMVTEATNQNQIQVNNSFKKEGVHEDMKGYKSKNHFFRERIHNIMRNVQEIKQKLGESQNQKSTELDLSSQLHLNFQKKPVPPPQLFEEKQQRKSIHKVQEHLHKFQKRNQELKKYVQRVQKFILKEEKDQEEQVLTNEAYTTEKNDNVFEIKRSEQNIQEHLKIENTSNTSNAINTETHLHNMHKHRNERKNTIIDLVNDIYEKSDERDENCLWRDCRKVESKVELSFEKPENNSYQEIDKIRERVVSMFSKIHSLRNEDADQKTTNTQKHNEEIEESFHENKNQITLHYQNRPSFEQPNKHSLCLQKSVSSPQINFVKPQFSQTIQHFPLSSSPYKQINFTPINSNRSIHRSKSFNRIQSPAPRPQSPPPLHYPYKTSFSYHPNNKIKIVNPTIPPLSPKPQTPFTRMTLPQRNQIPPLQPKYVQIRRQNRNNSNSSLKNQTFYRMPTPPPPKNIGYQTVNSSSWREGQLFRDGLNSRKMSRSSSKRNERNGSKGLNVASKIFRN